MIPPSWRARFVLNFAAGLVLAIAGVLSGSLHGVAQIPDAPGAASGVPIPTFWDPKGRPERADLPVNTVIRFLSETNYPPFNYAGSDGNPIGLNVDLARMMCEQLRVACTVQMRRFDMLLGALDENRGDAVIASIAATPLARSRADFSDPYYRTPARFVARRDSDIHAVLPERLEGAPIGAVQGTAHEAYLRTFFAGAAIRSYPSDQAAREAVRTGEVSLLFGDAIQLAFWLNGSDAHGCCIFRGGPFTESRYFGEGIGVAVRRGNDRLCLALNWALFRVWETGRYDELWLRYFPVSPF